MGHNAESITGDLMKKAAADVTAALVRTLRIATERELAIALSAGAAVLGVMAAILHEGTGDDGTDKPDPECVYIAALICARAATGGLSAVEDAYQDVATLRQAGRMGNAP